MAIAPAQTPDPVLKILVGMNMTPEEANFRGILDGIVTPGTAPTPRDLAISTVAVLMSYSQIPWPAILRAINALRRCPDPVLKEAAVVVVNGSFLLLPDADGSFITIEMGTMRVVQKAPLVYVGITFSVTTVWERINEILTTP